MLGELIVEIVPRLFIGDLEACPGLGGPRVERNHWNRARPAVMPPSGFGAVVHACKIPCHQAAVPDSSPAHPEYLIARRSVGGVEHLILNMIDPPDPKFFRVEVFRAACAFLVEMHAEQHRDVLLHCNQGLSRAPSIALVYLYFRHPHRSDISYDNAVAEFRSGYYPAYAPGAGISAFLRENWGPSGHAGLR